MMSDNLKLYKGVYWEQDDPNFIGLGLSFGQLIY